MRDGLFDLATRATDEVEELPEKRRDELGDVIRGFNQIQRRMGSTIRRIREAEDAARRSAQQTAQAMADLRRTQESLLQSERLASLGSLVAGVAHEINTPVGIALTSASVLRTATDELQAAVAAEGLKKSVVLRYLETAAESTRLIMNNANRAAHLIHSFKQIAVDQTSEARRPFALMEYVGEIVTSLRPKLKSVQIDLHLDGADDIVLDSYPGAFAQVITNLVLNCAEHAFGADQPGTIRINARLVRDMVELELIDNGKGIAADVLDRIFDPFFTTRRGQGGTGLGLNIVYNLVAKQFGGTITARSTPGHGTQFTVRIPRVAAAGRRGRNQRRRKRRRAAAFSRALEAGQARPPVLLYSRHASRRRKDESEAGPPRARLSRQHHAQKDHDETLLQSRRLLAVAPHRPARSGPAVHHRTGRHPQEAHRQRRRLHGDQPERLCAGAGTGRRQRADRRTGDRPVHRRPGARQAAGAGRRQRRALPGDRVAATSSAPNCTRISARCSIRPPATTPRPARAPC